MPNVEGSEENVLGKGIDAIFRRTTRLQNEQDVVVDFSRGVATREGDEVIIRLRLKPEENLLSALRQLLKEAKKGIFDPLTDFDAMRESALKSARKAAQAFKQGDPEMSIVQYIKALEILEDLNFRYNLALAYEAVGQPATAVMHYERLVTLNPEDVDAWNNLSAMYYKIGKPDKAMSAYERAVLLDPRLAQSFGEDVFQSRNRPRDI
ncbi:tetratricopeptide repeat protein [bacterium]|nr:tetratricopeptide repeat protein [candidate division CSSED10-310 bacterium]